jgi:hypothetical protein
LYTCVIKEIFKKLENDFEDFLMGREGGRECKKKPQEISFSRLSMETH